MTLLPLDDDPEVSAWLASKLTPLHASRVVERDLARALPRDFTAPWARIGGRGWREAGYRLAAPMYDATGAFITLHARRVVESLDGLPRTLMPVGCSPQGLVMACPLGRRMLAGDDAARRLLVAVTEARARRGEGAALVIVEGLTDYLAAAASHSDADEDAPAVLGIVSGSWSRGHGEALAARIPDDVSVCIATDDDDAGDRYAADVRRTLGPRVKCGALPRVVRRRAVRLEADTGPAVTPPDDDESTFRDFCAHEAEWWAALEADPI